MNSDHSNIKIFSPFADNKYPHHHTGHYRNKSSKIWDPHPQYQIDAAENHFVIHLQQEPDLVAPKFEVMNHSATVTGGFCQSQKLKNLFNDNLSSGKRKTATNFTHNSIRTSTSSILSLFSPTL